MGSGSFFMATHRGISNAVRARNLMMMMVMWRQHTGATDQSILKEFNGCNRIIAAHLGVRAST